MSGLAVSVAGTFLQSHWAPPRSLRATETTLSATAIWNSGTRQQGDQRIGASSASTQSLQLPESSAPTSFRALPTPEFSKAASSPAESELENGTTDRVALARRLLTRTAVGDELSHTITQRGGVNVRFGQLDGAWGAYRILPQGAGEITLSNELLAASVADAAAVLSHEMQHVIDQAVMGPQMNVGVGCFTTEINAFSVEALVWRSLNEQLGSSARNGHVVEAHLDALLHIQDAGRPVVVQQIVGLYGHRCSP